MRVWNSLQVPLDNLQLVGSRMQNALYSAEVHLQELALLAAQELRDRPNAEILEELASLFSTLKELPIPLSARITFLQHLSTALPSAKITSDDFGDAQSENDAQPTNQIAYVPNPRSEAALKQFFSVVSSSRALEFDHFEDVCEEVYNGLCKYCLLPVSNAVEGRLSRFCGLFLKYDLRICAACDVLGPAEGDSTRFVLLSKTLPPLPKKANAVDRDLLFCLALPTDTQPTLTELLEVAAHLHLQVKYIDTQPDFVDGRMLHLCRIGVKGGDLATFLLYLQINAPHFTPIGLYAILPRAPLLKV